MNVLGTKLTQEQLDKAVVWGCTSQGFTIGTLAEQLQRSRVPSDIAPVAAQRLIRKWKDASKILFTKGRWRWQK